MKKHQLIFSFFSMFFSKTTFASIGIADGPAIDYGLGYFGLIFLFIVSIILLIELLILSSSKKKRSTLNAIILSLLCLTILVLPKINEVLSGDYIIYSQEQLDELGASNISKIKGHLLISGVRDLSPLNKLEEVSRNLLISFEEWDIYKENKDLKSLKGLNNLKVIGGKLTIKYTSLTNLKGLDNLNTVKGGIKIANNSNLITLKGLQNIASSFNHINLTYNSNLQSVEGLENIKHLESLYLFQNQSLLSLKGLDNLTTVNSSFSISRNNQLSTLSNLSNLISINNSYFSISGTNLSSLKGLNNLKNIGGNLSITDNQKLPNLIGLGSLKTIGEELIIGNNSLLNSLNGLDNLDSIGGNLQIGYYKSHYRSSKEYDRGNKKLSDYCAIKNTKILGKTFIKYNLINPNIKELNLSDNCKKSRVSF